MTVAAPSQSALAYNRPQGALATTLEPEARLAAAFSHSNVGFAQCDSHGQFLLVNEAYCKLVGRTQEELLGLRIQDVTHPEDLGNNAVLFRRCLAEGEPFIVEKRYIRPDGSSVWVSNSVAPVQGADGQIVGALSVSIGIDDRRKAEEARRYADDAVRASEEFSRSIIESSPDCVKVLDLDGALQFMNGNGQCIMEIDDFAPLCGRRWRDLWPKESWGDIEAALDAARHGYVGRFSAFCPTAKGTPKWWDVMVTPVLNAAGQPDRLISVSRDITEVQNAKQRLDSERQRLLQLFEQAPGFMAVLNGPKHVFELSNAAYRTTIGGRDVLGKSIREALPELEGQGYFDLFDKVYVSGEPFIGRGSRALVQRHPDRPPEEGYFDFILQPIIEPDGSVSGIFVQGHEVTEQKLIEQELRAANEEIQRFAYIVSHDLRAPLVNVMGFTTELEATRHDLEAFYQSVASQAPTLITPGARAAFETDLPEALHFIRSSTSKMDRLISAILKLSREGQRVITPEPIKMGQLLGGYRDILAHQLAESQAELAIEAVPDLISDRLAIEQIFGNLIENAVKYLDPHRPGRIVVRGWEVEPYVRYEVEDNGRGIERKDFERIFDLFRRAGNQDQQGDGIGLAHVRALVRRLGGSISVSSEPRVGSRFMVTLPKAMSIGPEVA